MSAIIKVRGTPKDKRPGRAWSCILILRTPVIIERSEANAFVLI
nr:MAG TPA: hypothetical protein [Caudoviricetes sp.]